MPKSLIALAVAACLSLAAAPAQAHRGRDIAAFSWPRETGGVYVLHPRKRAIRRVSGKTPYFVNASTRVAWSPDRSKVAFEAGSEYSENIYVWNKRTGRVRRITDQPGREVHPSWSPDGTRIVYLHEGDSTNLFVVRSDGTRRRRLTRDGTDQYHGGPEWSPDGSTIAYPSLRGLFVIRPDGSGKRRLTDNTFDLAPSWAPGSRRLVFTRIRNRNGDGDAVLFTIRRDGSHRRRITDSRYRDEEPEWAPDGSRIVFVRKDYRDGVEPTAFIQTVRPNGRRLRRVTQDISSEGLGDFFPAWSPGSKRIAYLRYHRERDERSHERNVWVMRRDGSRNRNLTPDGGPGGFFGLDW